MSLEGVFLRNAFWGPCKTTLFADFYISGGPDGTHKFIKKDAKIEDPEAIMGESGLRSHGPKMNPNLGCRVINIYIYIYLHKVFRFRCGLGVL